MKGLAVVATLLLFGSAGRPAPATSSESNHTSELQYLAGSWTCTFRTPDGTVHGPLAQTVVAAAGSIKSSISASIVANHSGRL